MDDADRAVYEANANALMRFATFLVGPSDAADIVSAAVLRSFTAASWPSVADGRAYLFRAVLNEARMWHRSNRRRRAREARFDASTVVAAPEVYPEIHEALARLSPRQRAVIVLTYWDDLPPAAIAELLGVSEGAVRRHLARARAALRSTLHDERTRRTHS